MRPVHILLIASLAANVLVAIGYFHTRKELERRELSISGSATLRELELSPDQMNDLRRMRRTLIPKLRSLRAEWQPLFDAALEKMRKARPGDTSFEKAFEETGEVRRRQTVVLAHELIVFREKLNERQLEIFNRHIGEWPFIETLIGIPPDGMRSAPAGPFQATPPPPPKNGR